MSAAIKVMVIDDDADYTASVRALLESEGYEVSVASSGRAGLELLRADAPDVIVLDVMMESQVEGYVVNQAVKYQPEFQEYSRIPIVMVSSIEESPDERFSRSEEVGMIRPDAYLTKPLDIPAFLAAIERAAKRRRTTPSGS
jgi:CheY-like chemotaxis protein